MAHPLVEQLRFARSEFVRGLEGVSEVEGCVRHGPMNCISWTVCHLAWQEQRYWLSAGQGTVLIPELNTHFAYGAPASTPSLAQSWQTWRNIIAAADPWLDTLSTEALQAPRELPVQGGFIIRTYGSLMLRTIYHYWYHLGEGMAVRQILGHTDLPDFVGNIDDEAPYVPH